MPIRSERSPRARASIAASRAALPMRALRPRRREKSRYDDSSAALMAPTPPREKSYDRDTFAGRLVTLAI